MNANIQGSETRRRARSWQQGPLLALLVAGAVLAAAATTLSWLTGLSPRSQLVMAIGWMLFSLLLITAYRPPASRTRFGAANTVTLARAMLTFLLAGLAFEVGLPGGIAEGLSDGLTDDLSDGLSDVEWSARWAWMVSGIALLALALDGVDGPIARATGQESSFGARFDMETDAFLAFVLAVYIVRSGELGFWILALGMLRYVFVAASWFVPALTAELFPSQRRKVVCVLQIAALCLIVSPALTTTQSLLLGAFATFALSASFLRDVHWLLSRRSSPKSS